MISMSSSYDRFAAPPGAATPYICRYFRRSSYHRGHRRSVLHSPMIVVIPFVELDLVFRRLTLSSPAPSSERGAHS